jgi:hypothetical protein
VILKVPHYRSKPVDFSKRIDGTQKNSAAQDPGVANQESMAYALYLCRIGLVKLKVGRITI